MARSQVVINHAPTFVLYGPAAPHAARFQGVIYHARTKSDSRIKKSKYIITVVAGGHAARFQGVINHGRGERSCGEVPGRDYAVLEINPAILSASYSQI